MGKIKINNIKAKITVKSHKNIFSKSIIITFKLPLIFFLNIVCLKNTFYTNQAKNANGNDVSHITKLYIIFSKNTSGIVSTPKNSSKNTDNVIML